ncbi:hypothetical protein GGI12_005121 [Dipsacomyces acuminosporus]|nr:hypothetical protein GGI12_005121 [Dipsacomyces acuminosporus]
MSENTNAHEKASNADTQHEGTEGKGSPNIVQGLSDAAQNIGASLQAMQGALISNMQQAAQMTVSMNMMMEELVKRALQISVMAKRYSQSTEEPEPAQYQTILAVKVRNRSPIPLVNMAVKLQLTPISQLTHPVSILLKPAHPVSDGSDDIQLVFKDASKALDGDGDFLLAESAPTNLASGAAASTCVSLEVDVLEQLNGQISVEFISPGTGKTLAVVQKFGIRLLNLIDCHFVNTDDSKAQLELAEMPDADTTRVDVKYMREVFSVPPVDGIGAGSTFVLSINKQTQLALQVQEISSDSQSATCKWMAKAATPPETPASGSIDPAAISSKVAAELGSLH